MAWPSPRSRDGGVDEVPVAGVTTGRLFLCGKHAVGPDPDALLERVGATTVVCLNELHEIEQRYPQYAEWLRVNVPDRAVHHPMPDLHASSGDDLRRLVDALYERLVAGERLVITCGAGIGRAGTIAVAVLMRAGASLDDAVATVRAHRPMAGPESGAQIDVLTELASRRGPPSSG
jgi:protein-tyrosine phosphatase